MSDLSQLNGAKLYAADVYVADYTQAWQQAHQAGLPEPAHSGVVISEEAFDDLNSFHLQNPKQVEYWGVNLESNKGIFASGEEDCECVFQSARYKKKGWLLLLELKYCKDQDRNLTDNLNHAFNQVTQSYSTLTNKGYVNPDAVRVYCNIAAPTSAREPFTNFLTNQDSKKEKMDKLHINLLGLNEVLILNECYIKVPYTLI